MEIEEKLLSPNGWRLPTCGEWAQTFNEFGRIDFRKKLGLRLQGYIPAKGMPAYNRTLISTFFCKGADTFGDYWSRTKGTDRCAWLLDLTSRRASLVWSHKDFGGSVRCISQ